jgi:hypothetical protein
MIFFLLYALITAVITQQIASAKNLPGAWWLLGAVLGILALIWVAATPAKTA